MSEFKPKVSIIVPVYNAELYLGVCLESLVKQTLDCYEIILVNDGSPDNSQEIIDEYAEKYPNIIKPFIKENGGVSDARNYGLKKAEGEYIGFVDSDDCVRTDMLELLYNKAKATDSDIAVCSYSQLKDKIKDILFTQNQDQFDKSVKEDPEILFSCKPYLWNKIYRKAFWDTYNFSFPLNQWFEDDAIIYSILYCANKITAVPECLYYYRKNNEFSITRTIDNRIYDIFKACDKIAEFFSSYSDNKKLMEVIIRLIQIHLFVRLDAITKTGKKFPTLEYYWKMILYLNRIDPEWRTNKYLVEAEKKSPYRSIRNNPIKYTIFTFLPSSIKEKRYGTYLAYPKKQKTYCYINNERIKTLQNIELNILKEVDRICKEHNLVYYLCEGTLLGAVRNKGFIPWDDDLDISMPRDDYEKFLSIANDNLSPEYIMLNETVYDSYYLPFSKVVSLNNHGYINKLDLFPEKYNGPYIDIFPLDGFNTTDPKLIEKKYLKIRELRDLLLLKAGYKSVKSSEDKKKKIISSMKSYKKIYKELRKEMVCTQKEPKYLCNFASSYHPLRQIIEREAYGKPIFTAFEDGLFPIPRDAEKLLETIYGDYMLLPRANKRTMKHSFYDPESIANMVETKTEEDKRMRKEEITEIREIRNYEKEILKEIDRICKENNIRYFLAESTLLDAVQSGNYCYNGNDIKIELLRKDFEKFIAICQDKLRDKYDFQYYTNNEKYTAIIPRIRDKEVKKYSQKSAKYYTEYTGPYVSIYPLDNASSDIEEVKRQKKIINDIRTALIYRNSEKIPKYRKEKIAIQLYKNKSITELQEQIKKEATKYNNVHSNYVCNYLIKKEAKKVIFPISAFAETAYKNLEEEAFAVPKGYDEILTIGYGEYMKRKEADKTIKHTFE